MVCLTWWEEVFSESGVGCGCNRVAVDIVLAAFDSNGVGEAHEAKFSWMQRKQNGGERNNRGERKL